MGGNERPNSSDNQWIEKGKTFSFLFLILQYQKSSMITNVRRELQSKKKGAKFMHDW